MKPIICLECGYILGAYIDVFNYMKEILLSSQDTDSHIDNKIIDPELNQRLDSIFDILNIKKYCCRSSLYTNLEMHELNLY